MSEVVRLVATSARCVAEAGVAPPASTQRFHGLDGVRVAAMLLGVFYHLPIAMMTGGFGMGFGFGSNPKTSIDNWLHSFRMPLFFLVSGFLANMMLRKYGMKRYLTRRWWRIGAPLFVSIFAFAGVRLATDKSGSAPNPAFGAVGATGFGFGVGAGAFNATGAAPFGGGDGVFTPPPTTAPGVSNSIPYGFGTAPFGAAAGGPQNPTGMGGFSTTAPPLSMQGTAPATIPTLAMPSAPSRNLADNLFKENSRHFNLEHLWFLWYLLVFVTLAPCVVIVTSWVVRGVTSIPHDGFGRGLVRFNLFAFALGLITLPALLHARGIMGWSLANPLGFLAPFPDFLFQYQADMPFYFLYFLAGWWLYRLRDGLSGLSRFWLWNLALGIAAFAVAQSMSNTYAQRPAPGGFDWVRLAGYALYSVGAAYTACGFIGFFQRFLDRPTRPGRYLADTILWVYLVHLPLIPYLLWWLQPSSGTWWGTSIAGVLMMTGVALVLYELLIRPTPLVHIFGPPLKRQQARG